jgi:hypothetical protein
LNISILLKLCGADAPVARGCRCWRRQAAGLHTKIADSAAAHSLPG